MGRIAQKERRAAADPFFHLVELELVSQLVGPHRVATLPQFCGCGRLQHERRILRGHLLEQFLSAAPGPIRVFRSCGIGDRRGQLGTFPISFDLSEKVGETDEQCVVH